MEQGGKKRKRREDETEEREARWRSLFLSPPPRLQHSWERREKGREGGDREFSHSPGGRM